MLRHANIDQLADAGLSVLEFKGLPFPIVDRLLLPTVGPIDTLTDPFSEQFRPVDRDAPIDWEVFPDLGHEESVDYPKVVERELGDRLTWPALLALFSRSEEGPRGSYDFHLEHPTSQGVVYNGLRVARDGGTAWLYNRGPNGGGDRRVITPDMQGRARTKVLASELLGLCCTRVLR
jgi:hypothetical protein